MGKLPVARIFDTALIATSKAFSELRPFIEWVQSYLEISYRTLNGNVTISNNLAASTFTFSAKSTSLAYSTTVRLGKRPMAVWVVKQSPVTPMITSFAWATNAKAPESEVDINLTFSIAPTSAVDVTVLAFFG